MPLIREVLRNINVLNITLIAGLVFFIVKVLLPSYRVDVTPVVDVTERQTDRSSTKERVDEDAKRTDDYSIITENNLFHPERRFVIPKQEEMLPKPDFVLYGTLLAGDIKVAYMEDLKSPFTTSGRGKRQRSVHLGEMVSGYTLSEIYNDRVVMVRGDDRIEVKVMDLSKQKHLKPTTTQPQQTSPQSPQPVRTPQRQTPRNVKPPTQLPPAPLPPSQ